MTWKIHPQNGKRFLDIRWKAQLGENRRQKIQRKLDGILNTSVQLPEVLTLNYRIHFQFQADGKSYLFLNADDDRPSGGLYRLVDLS